MVVLDPLDSRHRSLMAQHLLSLSADDRVDRFMAMVSDDYVLRYVNGIGYARDILIGAFHEGALVGLAHAAVYLDQGDLVTEVGVSVQASARRRGLGRLLLVASIDAARRFNVRRVLVLFRATNRAMAALTRSVGGRIERDATESHAVFEVNAGPDLPLRTTFDGRGGEVLQAIQPRERGRALLIHGAGGDSYQWLPVVVPALWAAGFSVCAPTLPGHGRAADPTKSTADELQACVAEAAAAFAPTLIIGHSLGGYLVQRHLQTRPVARGVLLASLPPTVPRERELRQVMAQLTCKLAGAAVEVALTDAPDLEGRAASVAPMLVIGGSRDRVVPMPWVRQTAARYGVQARMVNGGHRVMYGRAAEAVMRTLAA